MKSGTVTSNVNQSFCPVEELELHRIEGGAMTSEQPGLRTGLQIAAGLNLAVGNIGGAALLYGISTMLSPTYYCSDFYHVYC